MKYIVLRKKVSEGLYQDIPIIFPEMLVHSQVADAMQKIDGFDTNCTIRSAGSVNVDDVECYGKSVTLNLQSREAVDSNLINTIDYNHGLVSSD